MTFLSPRIWISFLLAAIAHRGQYRRGLRPNGRKVAYVWHPIEVAWAVRDRGRDYIIVALLHDVLEDTNFPIVKWLPKMGLKHLEEPLRNLTKKRKESYPDFVERAMRHPISKYVKYKDILCNLADKPTEHQVNKYAAALQQFAGRLKQHLKAKEIRKGIK